MTSCSLWIIEILGNEVEEMPDDIDEFRKLVGDVPWLTSEGYLDLTKFPIDSVLRQALAESERDFFNAVMTLRSMLSNGRQEAGVFLLGLLADSGDDWARRTLIVDALKWFQSRGCADFLLGELKRVKSNNTTRRYLGAVLETLSRMPLEFVETALQDLAADTSFTPKMRDKFEQLWFDMREAALRRR